MNKHGKEIMKSEDLAFEIEHFLLPYLECSWSSPRRHLLPSIFPSIRVFSNKLVLHIRWSKYCS